MHDRGRKHTQHENILISSTMSGALSSLLVNPLDVLKIRTQVEQICKCLECSFITTPLKKNKHKHSPSKKLFSTAQCTRLLHTGSLVSQLRGLVQREGPSSLLKGAQYSMLINGLSSGTFFLFYEQTKIQVTTHVTTNPFWYPLVSSSLARTAQTLLLFPLDYLKTVKQARPNPLRGSHSMFTALTITFKRDLLFSSTYWVMAENLKYQFYSLACPNSPLTTGPLIACNLVAGSIAGAISGVLTLPLDVIKTRKQVLGSELLNQSTLTMLSNLYHQEGIAALFAGLKPRLAKTVIHCSLVLSMYETTLHLLTQWKPHNYLF